MARGDGFAAPVTESFPPSIATPAHRTRYQTYSILNRKREGVQMPNNDV